jgi:hypothetical protein
MRPRFDSYCGIYCGACPVMAANLKGNVEEKAKAWGANAKDLVCNGCKTRTNAKFCKECVMRLCAIDRGVDFCADCEEYPCPSFQTFQRDRYPHHTLVAPNLAAICELWITTRNMASLSLTRATHSITPTRTKNIANVWARNTYATSRAAGRVISGIRQSVRLTVLL